MMLVFAFVWSCVSANLPGVRPHMGKDCCCSGLISEFQLQQISVGSFSNEMLAKKFSNQCQSSS